MSIIYRTTFPQYLQAVAIGPDASFMEKNTTNCELVSAFPLEVDLMYAWKRVKRSTDPLISLRDFTKKFILDAPELDVQMIHFFVKKIKNFPIYYSNLIQDELPKAFIAAGNIQRPISRNGSSTKFSSEGPMQEDDSFLNELAAAFLDCNSPCNYLQAPSDIIGTFIDIGKSLVGSTTVPQSEREQTPPPLGIGMNIYNKIVPSIRREFIRLKIATEKAYNRGVAPFFRDVKNETIKPSDISGERIPLAGDTKSLHTKSKLFSETQFLVKQKLGDCYRTMDDAIRYNPYDRSLNLMNATRKFMGYKHSGFSSVIDLLGKLAPPEIPTENTKFKTHDVDKGTLYSTFSEDGYLITRVDNTKYITVRVVAGEQSSRTVDGFTPSISGANAYSVTKANDIRIESIYKENLSTWPGMQGFGAETHEGVVIPNERYYIDEFKRGTQVDVYDNANGQFLRRVVVIDYGPSGQFGEFSEKALTAMKIRSVNSTNDFGGSVGTHQYKNGVKLVYRTDLKKLTKVEALNVPQPQDPNDL